MINMTVTHVCFREQTVWERRHPPQPTETAAARRGTEQRNQTRKKPLSLLNKVG